MNTNLALVFDSLIRMPTFRLQTGRVSRQCCSSKAQCRQNGHVFALLDEAAAKKGSRDCGLNERAKAIEVFIGFDI